MNVSSEGIDSLQSTMSVVLNKVERMEHTLSKISDQISKAYSGTPSEHIPMTVAEACDFLSVSKATMYFFIQNGMISATRTGRKYIFFKDDLIKWVESGDKNRMSSPEPTTEEINDILSKRPRRKRKN